MNSKSGELCTSPHLLPVVDISELLDAVLRTEGILNRKGYRMMPQLSCSSISYDHREPFKPAHLVVWTVVLIGGHSEQDSRVL